VLDDFHPTELPTSKFFWSWYQALSNLPSRTRIGATNSARRTPPSHPLPGTTNHFQTLAARRGAASHLPPPDMASPGLATVQVNGVAALSRPDSPASINSSTKRKRDASDDGGPDPELNGRDTPKPVVNGVHKSRDEKPLIRDFFDVLQRYAPFVLNPSASSIDHPSSQSPAPYPRQPLTLFRQPRSGHSESFQTPTPRLLLRCRAVGKEGKIDRGRQASIHRRQGAARGV
jgi:hypothetical protein